VYYPGEMKGFALQYEARERIILQDEVWRDFVKGYYRDIDSKKHDQWMSHQWRHEYKVLGDPILNADAVKMFENPLDYKVKSKNIEDAPALPFDFKAFYALPKSSEVLKSGDVFEKDTVFLLNTEPLEVVDQVMINGLKMDEIYFVGVHIPLGRKALLSGNKLYLQTLTRYRIDNVMANQTVNIFSNIPGRAPRFITTDLVWATVV
jgi:hypothetical protein